MAAPFRGAAHPVSTYPLPRSQLVLFCYGVIPCAQPMDNFGRVSSRRAAAAERLARRRRSHAPLRRPCLGAPSPPCAHAPQLHALPCLPPQVYAVYGCFFIVLSYLWGWAVDGVRPDTGDWVGSGVAVLGGCLAFWWPGR